MAQLADTLLPLILLIGFGAVLGHIRFLGPSFLADLNKLVFWVALPSLIIRSLAHADLSGHQTWQLLATLVGATLLALVAAALLSRVFRILPVSRGTLYQNAFRGNLAYIGLPVISYSLQDQPKEVLHVALSSALLALATLTALFNVLAVFCLLPRAHASAREGWKLIARSIASNPIILACGIGLSLAWLRVPLPNFIDHTLQSLGGAAVPIALLCIGGSFAAVSMSGKFVSVCLGTLCKVALVPVFAWMLASAFGLNPLDTRIALIYAATPTAAAAYIMAKQLGGDEVLASGTIAMTTVVCFIPLAWILWFF